MNDPDYACRCCGAFKDWSASQLLLEKLEAKIPPRTPTLHDRDYRHEWLKQWCSDCQVQVKEVFLGIAVED